MNARCVAAIALLLAATAARGEVRIVRTPRGPALAVQPASRGVWTPVGVPDAATINPGGDLLGDSYPGQRTTSGRLLAAWQRPSSGSLVLLRADLTSAQSAVEVATDPGAGTPVVTAIERSWLVAWQAGLADPEVTVLLASGTAIGDPLPLVRGELAGVYEVGAALHVLTAQRWDNTLTIVTLTGIHEPNPIPIPTFTRVPWRSASTRQSMPERHGPALAVELDSWVPCLGIRADDRLLAWRAGNGLIGRAVLESDGVHADGEFLRGPHGSCEAILKAAGRD